MTSEAPTITIRSARAADLDVCARIIADPPSQEAIGICGDIEKARRVGVELVRAGISFRLAHAVVAEQDGRVVGVMDAGAGGDPSIGGRVILRVISIAMRTGGLLWTARTLWRQRLRSRVDFPTPKGSYYIAELDVDERCRNRGIGGALLRHGEDDARRRGFASMSLTTSMTNPARRLYERNGYRVVEEKRDADYERVTGIPGRILMVKEHIIG